jgi:hypothetical protein
MHRGCWLAKVCDVATIIMYPILGKNNSYPAIRSAHKLDVGDDDSQQYPAYLSAYLSYMYVLHHSPRSEMTVSTTR